MRSKLILWVAVSFLLVTPLIAAPPDAKYAGYREHVRPLFKDRCYACHGALKQESGLRLDTVRAMREVGILESDTLWERLTTDDPEVMMPPEGERLKSAELQSIRDWLDAGAPAPNNELPETDPRSHWAFQRIERPRVPEVGESNPIDAFLRNSHLQAELKPQPIARRSLLIRRLYLDLVGLPPDERQLRSQETIRQMVDKLLASPHYGERWGRHWMDVWRYSDWYGLGNQLRNGQRHLWRWRDWIVRSLNEDLGYDRMVLDMLAADEVAPDDLGRIAATGFLARNYYLFNRTTWLDDTIEHTSKAFLGLTVNCAKCHDHKYDPIDHQDYYRLRAIFEPHHVRVDALPGELDLDKDGLPRVYDDRLNAPTYVHRRGNPSDPDTEHVMAPGVPKFLSQFSESPVSIELPASAWAPGTREYVRASLLHEAERAVETAQKELSLSMAKAANAKLKAPVEDESVDQKSTFLSDDFQVAKPETWDTIGTGWQYRQQCLTKAVPTIQRSCLRSKRVHPRDFEATLEFQTTGGDRWRSTGIRFDATSSGDDSHTVYASAFAGGPKVQLSHTVNGKSIYPSTARVDRPIELKRTYRLKIQVRDKLINVFLDGEFLFAHLLPSRRDGGIELFAFDATANFYSIEVRALAPETILKNVSGKTGIAVSPAVSVEQAGAKLRLANANLLALRAQINVDDALLLSLPGGSRETAARRRSEADIAKLELDLMVANPTKAKSIAMQLERVKQDQQNGKLPKLEHVRGSRRALDQGSHKASQYSPIYPRSSTGRRTAFARWIIHRDNPLTARVAVNHIWTRHFGSPLVESSFDFGRRTARPLHTELLDYLAIELIENKWSMKHLHRLILNSKAWQRSSSNLKADQSTLVHDPRNLYFWRMNSRRMESQVIRDSLLQLSGQLDLKLGGPPVQPGPAVHRRSLYLRHSRDGRDKFVSTFDDADVFNCYRRIESIVPQQALAFMNGGETHRAAKRIAMGYADEVTDTAFAKAIFHRVLARPATERELAACVAFLATASDRSQFVHAILNHNDFQVIR